MNLLSAKDGGNKILQNTDSDIKSARLRIPENLNLLKPTGHVMHKPV